MRTISAISIPDTPAMDAAARNEAATEPLDITVPDQCPDCGTGYGACICNSTTRKDGA